LPPPLLLYLSPRARISMRPVSLATVFFGPVCAFRSLPFVRYGNAVMFGPAVKRRRVSTSVKQEPAEDAAPLTANIEQPLDGLWHDLCVPPEELRPDSTLTIGQCFNWRQAGADCWVGVLGREQFTLQTSVCTGACMCRQTPCTTLFRSLSAVSTDGDAKAAAALATTLREYFFLRTPLASLYQRWSEGDPRMAAVASSISGVRVVRQDPVECIFSFICSSNNNIPRITGMLGKLRRTYGDLLLNVGKGGLAATGALGNTTECEEWAKLPLELHSFPTVDALATRATEADLRAMGFGYRAKYIVDSAKLIHSNGGAGWALDMRNKDRDEVRSQLMTLCGVGPKVADCIALFSLDQASTIPVDVHVWRIACRDYDPTLVECKSLTPTVYARVGDLFRDRFGDRAGWAHSLLFAAELPGFKAKLSPEMQRQMDEFKREEREAKAESKAEKARLKEDMSSKSTSKANAKQSKRGVAMRKRGGTTR
ncbi:unnamed protein product, partial [Ectocarpus sp. 12 AP-2014]